jgi:hypothetical protein
MNQWTLKVSQTETVFSYQRHIYAVHFVITHETQESKSWWNNHYTLYVENDTTNIWETLKYIFRYKLTFAHECTEIKFE